MSNLSNIAVIGSGPTALYLLKYICDNLEVLKHKIKKISIFEKRQILGMGMPYHPKTTDIYNLSNISSEEIPMIQESFANWLRKQSLENLKKFNIHNADIDDSEVYSRVALGHYFEEQFKLLIQSLENAGIEVCQLTNSEVVDISLTANEKLLITDINQKQHSFSMVVIANGHEWNGEDKPESGFYASPWPIHKLIPQNKEGYNFPVGTLGASLSAFDVVTSLSHRHGVFTKVDNKLVFTKHAANPDFKLVLHSSEGWLPHLQYEQLKPIREIYRHFDRQQVLDLLDDNGLMSIEDYFDVLCRPALILAFERDLLTDVAEQLREPTFSFKNLVAVMASKHKYVDSFEGMKLEMTKAKNSVYNKIPIYWMETLDDLMYSLNYHAETLPAEDHVFFHREITNFLMNVIAALPLQSAEILLALHDAGCIELKSGRVNFDDKSFGKNSTKVTVVQKDGSEEEIDYKLFINCSGAKKLELEDYPFPTLIDQGIVRSASAPFDSEENIEEVCANMDDSNLIKTSNGTRMKLSGIDIDAAYRTINKSGKANNFLYDINFNHTNGLRPYSYGLQACSATSLILVESLLAEIVAGVDVATDIEHITELYEENDEL